MALEPISNFMRGWSFAPFPSFCNIEKKNESIDFLSVSRYVQNINMDSEDLHVALSWFPVTADGPHDCQ